MTGDPGPRGARKLVLVTGVSLVPDEALALIEQNGYAIRRVSQDQLTVDELHAALDGVSGYLIGGYEEPLAEHFEAAGALEAVAWIGTDYRAYVPGWRRAFDLGIAFVNSPGANAESVAEFTMLLALTTVRPFIGRLAMPGKEPAASEAPGRELRGRTLGIIGLGRIGASVARIAGLGFGMRTTYFAPRRNIPLEESLGVRYRPRHELLADSDIVTLHRPGPGEGEGPELGWAEMKMLRENTIIINAGHRGLIDPEALQWAIESRGVRAAIDAVGQGPAWDALVAEGPTRFLAVPQMGYHTTDANRRASLLVAEAVCGVLAGQIPDAVNNKDFPAVRRANGQR